MTVLQLDPAWLFRISRYLERNSTPYPIDLPFSQMLSGIFKLYFLYSLRDRDCGTGKQSHHGLTMV